MSTLDLLSWPCCREKNKLTNVVHSGHGTGPHDGQRLRAVCQGAGRQRCLFLLICPGKSPYKLTDGGRWSSGLSKVKELSVDGAPSTCGSTALVMGRFGIRVGMCVVASGSGLFMP